VVLFGVLSRTSLATAFLRSPCNPQSFNGLPPLEISCVSFFDRRRLFSIACGLFSQNTRGWVTSRLAFRTSKNALDSLRRLSALCVSALSFAIPCVGEKAGNKGRNCKYVWNQHLQKCIKTNGFNCLYNQHLCKNGEAWEAVTDPQSTSLLSKLLASVRAPTHIALLKSPLAS
jgi:hypothetical protein